MLTENSPHNMNSPENHIIADIVLGRLNDIFISIDDISRDAIRAKEVSIELLSEDNIEELRLMKA